jgi:hypothetical protein
MTPSLAALALMLVVWASSLLVLSWRRDWRPSLSDALLVAVGFRLAMFIIAKDLAPFDLLNDFRLAGQNILEHQDPTLNSRERGWSYLPTYGFLLAGMVTIEELTGLPWLSVSRVLPIVCDLGVVVVVYALADEEKRGLRAFQYACTPIAIFVSAVHGQMEPLCLLLALTAFLALRRFPPRVVLAGILIGLAISVKTWPVLFLPALLIPLPNWRSRVQLLLSAAGVGVGLLLIMPLTVGTPVHELPDVVQTIVGYSPAGGTWGWSAVIFAFFPYTDSTVAESVLWTTLGRVGSVATLIAVTAAIWWWRRANPIVVAGVTASAFQITTAGHGAQYLQWAAPFTTIAPTRRHFSLHVAIGVWAWWGYIVRLGGLVPASWGQWPDHAWRISSLVLIVLIVRAMPWRHRGDPAWYGDVRPRRRGRLARHALTREEPPDPRPLTAQNRQLRPSNLATTAEGHETGARARNLQHRLQSSSLEPRSRTSSASTSEDA